MTPLGFAALSLLLMFVPGPNVALIIATSLAGGFPAALRVVAGTCLGIAVQLALVSAGILGLRALPLPGHGTWLGWVAPLLLLALGVLALRPARPGAAPRLARSGTLPAALISSLNPKTGLFLFGLLPGFVPPGPAALPRLALLSCIFLGLAAGIDTLWALAAARVAAWRPMRTAGAQRLAGAFLIGTAVLLLGVKLGR